GLDGGVGELPKELGPVEGDAEWASWVPSYAADGVLCHDATYGSEGLRIVGRVCEPDVGSDFPILIYNDELGRYADSPGDVRAWAKMGFAVFQSAYRGVGGSDGRIELCKGEVYDVRRMLQIAKTHPSADPSRIAMVGYSHGGCIGTKVLLGEMIAETTTFEAFVNVYGPSDIAAAFQSQKDFADNDPLCKTYAKECAELKATVVALEAVLTDVPGDRRTLPWADHLARTNTPLLFLHATGDAAVPFRQSCDLAAAIGDFQGWHQDGVAGANAETVPEGCSGEGIDWRTTGALPNVTFSADRILVVADTPPPLGHARNVGKGATLDARARAFVADKLAN
ncbi:MAG: prolyl oligopeptidase family serine peptidase, partial [Myxococcales bacterium]|nr:prolyl oligopeptidase family serine peptidase [Myxococcales bacterium]